MLMMTMIMMMSVDDDCDYDDDDDYDDEDNGYDDDYDGGIVGWMVQVLEVATNTAACNPASAADSRGSATNPRFGPLANSPRIV